MKKRIALAGMLVVVMAVAALFILRRGGDPDVILVTIDTLRADHVSYAGPSPVRTPFLDQLAREGVWFANAHAHNTTTLPSHTNILTGLLPYQHGVRENAGFVFGNKKAVTEMQKQSTVAAILRERGYATGAFVGAYPLDSQFGLDAGFDVYDDEYPKGPTQFATPERSAAAVLSAAQQWYESAGNRKKFLWVHLFEPHYPYAGSYAAEIAAVDEALGNFLRPILERRPNTLLIVTSDHGEGLGEHEELYHGLFAYESTLKVPLIVHEPKKLAPRVERSFVRHIDIVPTILARLGIDKPAELQGESLLAVSTPRDTYFEALYSALNLGWAPLVGMIHDGHKYIDLPVAELYDLPRDPHEKKNLYAENRRMTTRIRERLAAAAPGAANADRGRISAADAKNLMSLGYLTGTAVAKKNYTEADDPKNLVRYHLRLTEAVEHFRRGEVDRAIEITRKLSEERPEMTMARDLLATILQQSERGEQAEALLRQQIADGTADDAAKKRLGLLLAEKGEAREAVQILSPFATTNEPDLLNAYGIALADTGRAREAVQQFQRVLQIDPENAAALQNLGVVALRAGDVAQAQNFLGRALQLDPKLPRALNAMGVVYARQNDFPRALDAWQRCVALDARQYDALFNLGMVAARTGRPDQARRALTQFVNTAPPTRYARDIAAAKQALAGL